jgi:hypothetical protein
VAHDTRDEVIDYVRHWSGRTELPAKQLVKWMGMGMSKYHDWKKRYGQVHEHNGWSPATTGWKPGNAGRLWPSNWEHPLEGYRRLTYMLLDADREQAGKPQRSGISAAFSTPRALAYRHQLHQRLRHFLLPAQRAGRL